MAAPASNCWPKAMTGTITIWCARAVRTSSRSKNAFPKPSSRRSPPATVSNMSPTNWNSLDCARAASKIAPMRCMTLLLLALAATFAARGEIVSKPIEYKQGSTTLEGLWVYDDAVQGKRPSILVVHQWKGLGAYETKRSHMLAKLGYNVFAVDIYGKGVRPSNAK